MNFIQYDKVSKINKYMQTVIIRILLYKFMIVCDINKLYYLSEQLFFIVEMQKGPKESKGYRLQYLLNLKFRIR